MIFGMPSTFTTTYNVRPHGVISPGDAYAFGYSHEIDSVRIELTDKPQVVVCHPGRKTAFD